MGPLGSKGKDLVTEPFKVCAVGDTHANMQWICNMVIPYAQAQGCGKIMQLGDFGLIWRGAQRDNNLRKLNKRLDLAGIDLHFLPGNHEDHDLLDCYRTTEGPEGHLQVTPRIFYTGRVSKWEWAGRKIGAVGGAVSIDRDWRQSHERASGQKVWWKEEVLSSEEAEQAHMLGTLDVLFTHDAPAEFPETWLKPDLESEINRQRMSSIGRATVPKMWFHGHLHCPITYPFRHENGTCEVHGLDCDGSTMQQGVAILDLTGDIKEES